MFSQTHTCPIQSRDACTNTWRFRPKGGKSCLLARCALVVVMLVATACAHLSVIHLDKKPWVLGRQESLAMRYWEFTYTSTLEKNQLVVSGTAMPVTENIPDWATWIQDLWLQIYLSDDHSRVLAKDLRLYLPMDLDRSKGIPFEFHLTPEAVGAEGPLFISFGYRMEVTPGRTVQQVPGQPPRVFFASQGALFR